MAMTATKDGQELIRGVLTRTQREPAGDRRDGNEPI